jgi:hypothetical protein
MGWSMVSQRRRERRWVEQIRGDGKDPFDVSRGSARETENCPLLSQKLKRERAPDDSACPDDECSSRYAIPHECLLRQLTLYRLGLSEVLTRTRFVADDLFLTETGIVYH